MNISRMELIGSGAQADVYRYESRAVKVFKPGVKETDARYEADIQERAYMAGLPVPRIIEVSEIEGRMSIAMEYTEGRTLGEIMLADIGNVEKYIFKAVEMQIKVNSVRGEGFPLLKDKLELKINNNCHLRDVEKGRLVDALNEFSHGDGLCHGDFHVLNLICAQSGIVIIDWVDASCGNIHADICKSYLLYLLYREDIARIYLDAYCAKANIARMDVLRWLPVVAAARLGEHAAKKDIGMLLRLAIGADSENWGKQTNNWGMN